jgi:hypothetical protein
LSNPKRDASRKCWGGAIVSAAARRLPKRSQIRARRQAVKLDSQSPLIDGTRRDDVRRARDGVQEHLYIIERLLREGGGSEDVVEALRYHFGEIAGWASIARENLS